MTYYSTAKFLTLLQPDGGTGMILFFIVAALFYISPVTKEIKMKTTMLGMGFVIVAIFGIMVTGKSP